MKYRVCSLDEIPLGEKRRYTIKKLPIVMIHSLHDEFFALYDRCPHQAAPLSQGILCGLTAAELPGESFSYLREGEILRCPWHGFSYDVVTGTCLAAPDSLRVKTYPVAIEKQDLYIDI